MPGTTDLLRAAPFDRITLIDSSDLSGRTGQSPTAPADRRAKDGKRRGRDKKSVIPPEGNIIVGVPTKIELPGSDRLTPTASRTTR